jgi:hypothetical protein
MVLKPLAFLEDIIVITLSLVAFIRLSANPREIGAECFAMVMPAGVQADLLGNAQNRLSIGL